MSPFSVIFGLSDLDLKVGWKSWLEKREFQISFKEEILFYNINSSMFTKRSGYATATIIIPITKFPNLIAY